LLESIGVFSVWGYQTSTVCCGKQQLLGRVLRAHIYPWREEREINNASKGRTRRSERGRGRWEARSGRQDWWGCTLVSTQQTQIYSARIGKHSCNWWPNLGEQSPSDRRSSGDRTALRAGLGTGAWGTCALIMRGGRGIVSCLVYIVLFP
jgi:hypothetical protein